MRILNLLMAALFLFGAAVQFNDPDSAVWIVTYLVAAGACAFAHRNPASWTVPAVVAAACVIWAIMLAPSVLGRVPFGSMFGAWEMQNVGIEQSREMYGLLIIAAWMVVLAVRGYRHSRSGPTRASRVVERGT